jgi:hypothetical protein
MLICKSSEAVSSKLPDRHKPPHLNHKIKIDPSLQFAAKDPESSSWILNKYFKNLTANFPGGIGCLL